MTKRSIKRGCYLFTVFICEEKMLLVLKSRSNVYELCVFLRICVRNKVKTNSLVTIVAYLW